MSGLEFITMSLMDNMCLEDCSAVIVPRSHTTLIMFDNRFLFLERRGREERGNSRGQHFSRQVCDVGRDLAAGEELGHFVTERVTVPLKQMVLVPPTVCERKGCEWGERQ